jgi:hypothetical protein
MPYFCLALDGWQKNTILRIYSTLRTYWIYD